MKTKISIDLPTREKIVAGLTPRDVHPPLLRAEESAAAAEQSLARARSELARHEQNVAAAPAHIQRGEVRTDALSAALRDRDVCALQIEQAEQALTKAREKVADEEKLAATAVQREVARRLEQLERVAGEISPVLTELDALAGVLLAVLYPGVRGSTAVDWPCSARCGMERFTTSMNTAPAPPSLAWTGSKS